MSATTQYQPAIYSVEVNLAKSWMSASMICWPDGVVPNTDAVTWNTAKRLMEVLCTDLGLAPSQVRIVPRKGVIH